MNQPAYAMKIQVLIVDDQPIARIGMATIVGRQPDMCVAGIADSCGKALELYRRDRPDIVLMELRIGGEKGTHAAATLCAEHPDARIVILTNRCGDECIRQALAAGVVGYLFKNVEEEELIDAIREAHAGGRYLPKRVLERLHENRSGVQLTRREQELLDLLGKGLSNGELGQALGVSEDTVKSHLKNLFRKLQVSGRAEAVRESYRRGFITLE